ncbi:MAG: 3-isopropylmalate dehydratase small subunit [Prevotellaceae bacterium]|nr:3-isopropylmalate dehydratase small subunit [Prevotellaceae bacterium]MDY2749499.1 3-isopropylmalate dehydratase small subunit [Prevotella sp.]
MAKQKFNIIKSTCLPIAIDNCNTDLIIPARYLASTTRDPQFFGDAFMHDLRYDADGKVISDFVLNQPGFSETPREGVNQIIVGGKNWGSGSSREHAAWAIAGYGVRVVISSSFADIHRNNLLNCFVLPVVVTPEFQAELFDSIAKDPKTVVTVDVPNQTVTNEATGNTQKFEINGYKKYCLENALDEIDFLLENQEKIVKWEKAQ